MSTDAPRHPTDWRPRAAPGLGVKSEGHPLRGAGVRPRGNACPTPGGPAAGTAQPFLPGLTFFAAGARHPHGSERTELAPVGVQSELTWLAVGPPPAKRSKTKPEGRSSRVQAPSPTVRSPVWNLELSTEAGNGGWRLGRKTRGSGWAPPRPSHTGARASVLRTPHGAA